MLSINFYLETNCFIIICIRVFYIFLQIPQSYWILAKEMTLRTAQLALSAVHRTAKKVGQEWQLEICTNLSPSPCRISHQARSGQFWICPAESWNSLKAENLPVCATSPLLPYSPSEEGFYNAQPDTSKLQRVALVPCLTIYYQEKFSSIVFAAPDNRIGLDCLDFHFYHT